MRVEGGRLGNALQTLTVLPQQNPGGLYKQAGGFALGGFQAVKYSCDSCCKAYDTVAVEGREPGS